MDDLLEERGMWRDGETATGLLSESNGNFRHPNFPFSTLHVLRSEYLPVPISANSLLVRSVLRNLTWVREEISPGSLVQTLDRAENIYEYSLVQSLANS
jgi:hypothetical protein